MRKLIPTMLVILALQPVAGYALGLGDIRLNSGLNQPFSAEIDLLSVTPDEASSIDATLASYETFAQVGVERSPVLMMLHFEVSKRADGSHYVKVTSQKAIKEPFLDFLLEVNWRSGKLLREYTVLLDPPDLFREKPPVIAVPATPRQDTAVAATEPAVASPEAVGSADDLEQFADKGDSGTSEETDGVSKDEGSSETTSTADAAKTTDAEANKTKTADAASSDQTAAATQAEEARTAAKTAEAMRTSYGPVRKNETLWRIAKQMRSDKSISVQQVMVALLKANPDAFIGNNVNRLKSGAVLRLEDPAQLTALSKAEAAREIGRQSRAWEDYKTRAAQRASRRSPDSGGTPPAAAVAKTEEPRLKLVASEKRSQAEKADAAGSAVGNEEQVKQLREELMLAIESASAKEQENEELRDRLRDLEGQIAKMERLLSLQAPELAEVQNKAAENNQQDAAAKNDAVAGQSDVPSKEGTEAGEGNSPGTSPNDLNAEADQPGKVEKVQPVDVPGAAEPGAGSASSSLEQPAEGEGVKSGATNAPKPDLGADAPPKPENAPNGSAKTAVKPNPVPAEPVETVVAPQEFGIQSLAEDLLKKAMENPTLYGGIGGGVLVVFLLLWLLKRKRYSDFPESILTGGTSSMLRAKAKEAAPASEETSFFSDFAVSGGREVEAEDSEIDPLTEADLYLAYDRHQQAEELLIDSIRQRPDNAELHAKLLEVYYALKNQESFESAALTARPVLAKRQDLWSKVVSMGQELAPGNPLFQKSGSSAALDVTKAAAVAAPVGLGAFDIGLEQDSSLQESAASASSDFSLDLGLDFSDLDEPAQNADSFINASDPAGVGADTLGGSTDSSAGLDFDLGLSFDSEQSATSIDLDNTPDFAASTAAAIPELELGNFDLSTSEPQTGNDFGAEGLGDFGDLATLQEVEQPSEGSGFADLELGQADALSAGNETDLGGLDFGSASLSDESKMDLGGLGFGQTETQPASGEMDFGGLDLGQSEAQLADNEMDFGGLDFGQSGAQSADDEMDLGGLDFGQSGTQSTDTEMELGSLDFGQTELQTGAGEADFADLRGYELGSDSSSDFGGDGFDDEFFGELDEIGTKLDLARAYVDMGDGEGARSILAEVVSEGTLEQKQQAEQLLQQIA